MEEHPPAPSGRDRPRHQGPLGRLQARAESAVLERHLNRTLQRFTPEAAWHSWEPTPSEHPWLTTEHLAAMRGFSERVWQRAHRLAAGQDPRSFRFAFVGNLANNLYQRAVPLRRRGLEIEIVLHPHDRFVMSHPGWEEWDGELATDERNVDELARAGVHLPDVEAVVTPAMLEQQLAIGAGGLASDRAEVRAAHEADPFLRTSDIARFPVCLAYLPLLRHLQRNQALMTTQAPYLAYLSGRRYLAAPTGGDLWLDCSRGDEHGILQRLAFGQATAILATNPWSFGHARRFGFSNAIYLPFMLDDELFRPGPSRARGEWVTRTGGSFFVLQTARVDERYKGSSIALEGFARFARSHAGARLVLLGWGDDLDRLLERSLPRELRDRVLVLPLAGKRRLVDYLRAADVVVDQFALGAYGATALEAMGCGVPVVMRIAREQYDALLPVGAPPTCDATTAEEVARELGRLADDPAAQARAGVAAREWFLAAHGSSAWAGTYTALLVATALGARVSFRRSPLAARLTPAERDYHAEHLASAPRYLDFDISGEASPTASEGAEAPELVQ